MTKRRGPTEILHNIVKFCIKEGKEGGVLKTGIMYQANLGYSQLIRYLGLLLKWGWVEETKGENGKNTLYIATEIGTEAVGYYEKFLDRVPKEDLPLILNREYHKFYTPPKKDSK